MQQPKALLLLYVYLFVCTHTHTYHHSENSTHMEYIEVFLISQYHNVLLNLYEHLHVHTT